MIVAFHTPPVGISPVAGIGLRRNEYPLLQADQAVHRFESRTRRVTRHHGTVEQGTAAIVQQFHVIVPAFTSHQFVGIVRGAARHDEYLPRFGFDRHDAAHLTGHQLFGERLQPGVDRTGNRHAG